MQSYVPIYDHVKTCRYFFIVIYVNSLLPLHSWTGGFYWEVGRTKYIMVLAFTVSQQQRVTTVNVYDSQETRGATLACKGEMLLANGKSQTKVG